MTWAAVRDARQQTVETPGAPAPLTFAAVYAAHAPTVARWAARLGGPYADVEDITQEVFLVVDRRLAEFRGDSRLSTWLFSVTSKVAANERRRRKLRRWWFRLVPDAGEHAPAAGEAALEQLETRERRALFHRALDRLNDRHRQALVLFELEEMSIDDVAAHLGLRPGNVRVLLHRARAAFLKSMIACELEDALATNAPKERR
ncbi:MAG TPA: sigma-70 family RNA polymerase sigma factor [Polyangia bacterium]|jgi:RNA polymerase sigma-70 factor (ECF subfamily)